MISFQSIFQFCCRPFFSVLRWVTLNNSKCFQTTSSIIRMWSIMKLGYFLTDKVKQIWSLWIWILGKNRVKLQEEGRKEGIQMQLALFLRSRSGNSRRERGNDRKTRTNLNRWDAENAGDVTHANRRQFAGREWRQQNCLCCCCLCAGHVRRGGLLFLVEQQVLSPTQLLRLMVAYWFLAFYLRCQLLLLAGESIRIMGKGN